MSVDRFGNPIGTGTAQMQPNAYYGVPSNDLVNRQMPGMMPPQQMSPLYPQQNQIQRGLPGRVIRTLSEITPNEIPMDGSVSLFPAQDYSCIIAKAWNSEGTIDTIKFVRETPPNNSVPQEVATSEVIERLNRIEQMLTSKFENSTSKKGSEK